MLARNQRVILCLQPFLYFTYYYDLDTKPNMFKSKHLFSFPPIFCWKNLFLARWAFRIGSRSHLTFLVGCSSLRSMAKKKIYQKEGRNWFVAKWRKQVEKSPRMESANPVWWMLFLCKMDDCQRKRCQFTSIPDGFYKIQKDACFQGQIGKQIIFYRNLMPKKCPCHKNAYYTNSNVLFSS